MAAPAVSPKPESTFRTPGGTPACVETRFHYKVVDMQILALLIKQKFTPQIKIQMQGNVTSLANCAQ